MYGHVDVSFCFVNGQNNNFPFDFVHTQMLPHVYGEPGPMLEVSPPFLRVKQRASLTMPRYFHTFRACCQWPYLLCQRYFHNLQTGCCKALHKCLRQVHNCKLTTKDPLVSMIVKLWDCLLGHMGLILHVKHMLKFLITRMWTPLGQMEMHVFWHFIELRLSKMHVA
jgi:hypothetical protein